MYEQIPAQTITEPPKKSNTGLLIGIVVAVLLCCCCLIGGTILVLSVMGPAVNNVFSTINEGLLTPVAPDSEDFPSIPELPTDEQGNPTLPLSPFGYGGLIPQGGLGDDLLRADTWAVIAVAALSGCAAIDASQTTIEVVQQPDSSGAWQEKWTVVCDDGTKKSFDVTFTPSAQGGIDISVTSSK